MIIKRLTFALALTVIIGMLFHACKKEELKHYYVSDAFKRWTVFNKGSYWIYKNDSSSVTDSTFVKENPQFLQIPPYSSKDNFTLEHIQMSYTSGFLSSTTVNVRSDGEEIFYMYVKNSSFYPLIANSSDNFLTNYENVKEGTSYQMISRDSVFFLGQLIFYDVITTQFITKEKSWICCFAKDVGLIKISGSNTNPDFSWSVIRYRIEK